MDNKQIKELAKTSHSEEKDKTFNINQNVVIDPHISNLERLYEKIEERELKVEEEEKKESKKLNSSVIVLLTVLIIIIAFFALSYMNGSRVVGN